MSLRSLISPICYVVISVVTKLESTTDVVVICIVRTFVRNFMKFEYKLFCIRILKHNGITSTKIVMKIGWLIPKLNCETLISVLGRNVG
jgi:hypothetical protein